MNGTVHTVRVAFFIYLLLFFLLNPSEWIGLAFTTPDTVAFGCHLFISKNIEFDAVELNGKWNWYECTNFLAGGDYSHRQQIVTAIIQISNNIIYITILGEREIFYERDIIWPNVSSNLYRTKTLLLCWWNLVESPSRQNNLWKPLS